MLGIDVAEAGLAQPPGQLLVAAGVDDAAEPGRPRSHQRAQHPADGGGRRVRAHQCAHVRRAPQAAAGQLGIRLHEGGQPAGGPHHQTDRPGRSQRRAQRRAEDLQAHRPAPAPTYASPAAGPKTRSSPGMRAWRRTMAMPPKLSATPMASTSTPPAVP